MAFKLTVNLYMAYILLLVWFFVVVVERLGNEYVNWWYVQRMLPYGTGINDPLCIYIVVLICGCFGPFFFLFLNLVLKPDRNGQWYQHLLTFFWPPFYESNTAGTNFRIMFIWFMFVKCACFVVIQLVCDLIW